MKRKNPAAAPETKSGAESMLRRIHAQDKRALDVVEAWERKRWGKKR